MGKAKKSAAGVKHTATASKEYNLYLDVLKGFTILLVVLGHSLQTFVPNGQFDNNLLFRVIYSFHMPLFMFLAGAAAAYSSRPMNLKFIERKFYQLVVPFIAWYLLSYALFDTYQTIAFKTYIHHVIDSPDYGLWFLWVLFLNFVLLVIINKLTKWLKLYAYLVVWLVVYALPTGKYGIGLVKWHLPFFLIGFLLFNYRQYLSKYQRLYPYLVATCLIAAPILVLTWHRLYDPGYITSLEPRFARHGLSSVGVGSIASLNFYGLLTLLYSYVVPLSAIGVIYWLLQLRPSKHLWKFFGFFGLYTLDIYVMNIYFFRYAIGDQWWIRVITGFVISLALSLIIGMFVLRRVSILSMIFLGGRTTPTALSLKNKKN